MREVSEITIFGRSGQLARALAKLSPDLRFLGRDEADLDDPGGCAEAIRAIRPRAAINAAAWTAVDAAEENRETAFRVNAEAPGAMARAAAALGIPFVHLSTDYVFDGSGERPWRPDDPTGPLGVYGASKLAGEEAVRAAAGIHAIIRTSWVFSADGANFVKTMLRLSQTRDRLTIVADQIGGPTSARALASACLRAAEGLAEDPALSGTYHYAGSPDTSWADFARAIFAAAGRDVAVESIPTAEYPTPAPRPLNSRLDCGSFEAAFGLSRPDWRRDLEDVLRDLAQAGRPRETR